METARITGRTKVLEIVCGPVLRTARSGTQASWLASCEFAGAVSASAGLADAGGFWGCQLRASICPRDDEDVENGAGRPNMRLMDGEGRGEGSGTSTCDWRRQERWRGAENSARSYGIGIKPFADRGATRRIVKIQRMTMAMVNAVPQPPGPRPHLMGSSSREGYGLRHIADGHGCSPISLLGGTPTRRGFGIVIALENDLPSGSASAVLATKL